MKKLLSRFKPNKIKLLRKKNGVALPYVIIVSASLFILATTLCAVSTSDTVVFSERYNQRQAYITAKSVIEYSKAVLTDDMEAPSSFVVVAHYSNGEIDYFQTDNSVATLNSDSDLDYLNSYIADDDTRVGYCLVKEPKPNADNQQEYEITIKAVVNYTGAGHTPKTETLTFEGLTCKYSEKTDGGNKLEDAPGNFDGNFQVGQVNIPSWGGIGNADAITAWQNFLRAPGDDTSSYEYKGDFAIPSGKYKYIETFESNNQSGYTLHLENLQSFSNTDWGNTYPTVIQGASYKPLQLLMGTVGKTVFNFNGGIHIHQDSSYTRMNGKIANFARLVRVGSSWDVNATDWVRFKDGLYIMNNNYPANPIININGADAGGKFAVFEGYHWEEENGKNDTIMLQQNAKLNINNFEYIIVRKNTAGNGGGITVKQQQWNGDNIINIEAKKAVVIEDYIQCLATSATSGINIKATGEGAYVAIGGTITSSGAPVVISAIDSTKSGGYGPVYCQYTANGNENGVPVYKLTDMWGNILVTIYNPQPLANAPQDPDLPDFDNDLNPGNGGGGDEIPASKKFDGGYYH